MIYWPDQFHLKKICIPKMTTDKNIQIPVLIFIPSPAKNQVSKENRTNPIAAGIIREGQSTPLYPLTIYPIPAINRYDSIDPPIMAIGNLYLIVSGQIN